MSVNFIVQAAKIIHNGNVSSDNIKTIYDFILSVDNYQIINYYNTNNVMSFKNDLELYINIIDSMIKICEIQEHFEKCAELLNKKKEALSITKIK